ncbi:MAG: ABC transporter substrate-binding protein [Flavobacteriales bacterium]
MFHAGLFFLLVFGLGCSPSTDWDDPRVFRYNESTGLLSLDPAQARSLEPIWVVDQIFDGLTQLDSNLEVQPCIATDWVVDSTGTVYTFALRDDVHFPSVSEIPGLAQGRKVVAQDVEFSLNRLLDSEIASAGGWILEPLEKGRTDGGIEVLDEQHIRFHLTTAFPAFPGLLSTVYASVVPREAVAHYGLDFRRNPVGTGPFKLAWWEEDVAMVLHRNGQYWENDSVGVPLPYLEAIHIDFVRDAGAEAAGLKMGKYDFVSGLHAAYMEDFLTSTGSLNPAYHDSFRMLTTPYLKTDYIGLNVDASLPANSNSPVLDVRVRKALSLALDRQAMATHLKRGTVVPTDRFTPPALVGRSEPLPVAESLQQAKTLLAQSGYPEGVGWPENLKLLTTSEHADLCAALQHRWLQLGVNIGIEVVPPGVHRESVSAGEAPMFRKTWLGDYPDAENFLALFVSTNAAPSGPNYSRFQDSLYDQGYGTAVAEVDVTVRQQLYAELDASIHDQMPVIPLFHDQVIHFVRHNIENWSMNGVNRLDLRRVRKSRPNVPQ